MAEFRIDQPGGAGTGVAGESRVDLLPGFVIELHATPVAGAVFTWEIRDKVNAPLASLTATTGQTVNIGALGTDIPAFCGFMVRLTQNLFGVITVQERVVAVRSTAAMIRPPLFNEQAPPTQTLNSNDPALSTDNSNYPDLAGLGVPGNNPFGWREWAWELAKAVEITAGTVGSPAPLRFAGAARQVVGVIGVETVIGNFGAFDPTVYVAPTLLLEATFVFVPATAGSVEVRLYDMGTRLVPGPGVLRATIATTFADVGIQKCVSTALTVSSTPGTNTGDIQDAERIYELRAILIGANPGDALELGAVNLVVAPGIAGGGNAAPTSPSYLTLAAASGLLAERVFTPANSVVGTDGGPGAAYTVELDGDAAAPGPNQVYGTDGTGAKGWKPDPSGGAVAASAVSYVDSNPLLGAPDVQVAIDVLKQKMSVFSYDAVSNGPTSFTTWADLHAAMFGLRQVIVFVHKDLVISPGSWALPESVVFVGARTTFIPLQVQAQGALTGLRQIRFEGLSVSFAGAGNSIIAQAAPFNTRLEAKDCVISVSNPVTDAVMYVDNATARVAEILLENTQCINTPIAELAGAGARVQVRLDDGSLLDQNAFRGPGGNVDLLIADDASEGPDALLPSFSTAVFTRVSKGRTRWRWSSWTGLLYQLQQFTASNPLPAPFSASGFTDPALSSYPTAAGQVLRFTWTAAGAGAWCIFWIDDVMTGNQSARFKMNASVVTLSAGDEMAAGFAFVGDPAPGAEHALLLVQSTLSGGPNKVYLLALENGVPSASAYLPAGAPAALTDTEAGIRILGGMPHADLETHVLNEGGPGFGASWSTRMLPPPAGSWAASAKNRIGLAFYSAAGSAAAGTVDIYLAAALRSDGVSP